MADTADNQTLWDLLGFSTKDERHKLMAEVTALILSWQVRALRQSRAWTQAELATKAHLSIATIVRLENPATTLEITLTTLFKISQAFDVALIARFASWKEWTEKLPSSAGVPEAFDAEKLKALIAP